MDKEITINGEKYRKVEEIKKFQPRELCIDVCPYWNNYPKEMFDYFLNSIPPIKLTKDNNYEYKLFLKSKEVTNYVKNMIKEIKKIAEENDLHWKQLVPLMPILKWDEEDYIRFARKTAKEIKENNKD